MTASGSGLDPDISPAFGAGADAARGEGARHLGGPAQQLVAQYIKHPISGYWASRASTC